MYTSNVPEYEIDLELPESERWAEVIRKEKRMARRLARQALADYPGWLMTMAGAPFKAAYTMMGGRYVGEIEAWAVAMGISAGKTLLLNCAYEFSHVGELLLGCTAGVRWVPGIGMTHARTMDWPLPRVGDATRIYQTEKHEFVSVGIVGFVGVLSGMVPGSYSVTINWAPPVRRPTFDFGPTFLLREVLTECPTYKKAVSVLRSAKLSSSVFFTVCGTKKGEACVIERTHDQAAVRKISGPVLVQANHHVASKFLSNNAPMQDGEYDDEVDDRESGSRLEYSRKRADTLEQELLSLPRKCSLDDVAACLDAEPVCNDESYQMMLFHPKSGTLRAWRYLSDSGSAK